MSSETLLLTVNAGSSSLRVALFETDRDGAFVARLRVRIEPLGSDSAPSIALLPEHALAAPLPAFGDARSHQAALRVLLPWLSEQGYLERVVAVGHRVVHGGDRAGPALIDVGLLGALKQLSPLAPLHQPQALAAIDALRELLPRCAQVACFDTAFHRTMPATVRRYALPLLRSGEALLRHGFHGLSCESVAHTLGRRAPGLRRVVVAHLGAGASLTALRDGVSIDTTMGMTPLDGVPMATRSGALDPGVLLWLMQHGYDAPTLEDLLYRRSGLLGLSGESGDMRRLLASAEPKARQAIEIFTLQCAKAVAALAVSLEGLDALVFTGGIGEHAASVRSDIARRCSWLGLRLDPEANGRNATLISAPDSTVSAWVIPTDEEAVMARQVSACLAAIQV